MNPRSLNFLFILLLFSCEKDDICLEGTPATPRMIILFKDFENPKVKKVVEDLLIRGLGLVDSLTTFSGDSIAVPLRNMRSKIRLDKWGLSERCSKNRNAF